MTIGKSSKKSKTPKSPPFLDQANGFYGRLEETEIDMEREGENTECGTGTVSRASDQSSGLGWLEEEEQGVFGFNHGMMEDDGTATLLKRKPSRLSRRWSRRSSRKPKVEQCSPGKENQTWGTKTETLPTEDMAVDVPSNVQAELGSVHQVHLSVKEDADDQVLISAKREREMEPEEKRKEMEGKTDGTNMKIAKRGTLKNYRKALDRAFRRGWETFITNLYSVTLTPVTSSTSSSSSPTSRLAHNNVLAEFK